MGNINFHTKEILLKIVYYGPGLCGKTTSLKAIHVAVPEDKRSSLISLDTETDRTIHFDFLPIAMASMRGFDVRLQLYTVPGQVFYASTREIVLRGADGVVFVADSQRSRAEGNQISLDDLRGNLERQETSLDELPLVLQYNKRDLPDLLSIEELNQQLNPMGAPVFPTVASTGEGVHEALQTISKLAIKYYVAKNQIRT